MKLACFLADSDTTESLGGALAAVVSNGAVIYLRGDLGAGKTTLARGLLRALGHSGPVRSPTYTLVEPYELTASELTSRELTSQASLSQGEVQRAWHLDLYRLAGPEELEFLGVRELDSPGALVLVEWPERGAGMLPVADITVNLSMQEAGRQVAMGADTTHGEAILQQLLQINSNLSAGQLAFDFLALQ